MVLGEQALPVRSERPPEDTKSAFPFSRAIWLTAKVTDDVGTSTITSTFSVSYHSRAIFAPTSGLF